MVMPNIAFARQLFSLRGRCNRKGLALLALAMVALQLAIGLAAAIAVLPIDHPLLVVIKLVFVWLAIAAAAKRLHDTGRGIIWIPLFFIGLVFWSVLVGIATLMLFGPLVLDEANPGLLFAMAGNIAPAFAALLWLHFAKGAEGCNRYGPAPDESGFSMPEGHGGDWLGLPAGPEGDPA